MKKEVNLNMAPKQKLFANEYMIDLNATRAYKLAYKVKSDNVAAVNAFKLLRTPKMQQFIQEKQLTLANKLQITQEMVLEGYRKLAFYDARKFYDENGNLKQITDLDDETAFALSGFEVTEEFDYIDGNKINTGFTKKIKMSDRKAALDSICKVLGFNAPDKLLTANINYNTNLTAKEVKAISDKLESAY